MFRGQQAQSQLVHMQIDMRIQEGSCHLIKKIYAFITV